MLPRADEGRKTENLRFAPHQFARTMDCEAEFPADCSQAECWNDMESEISSMGIFRNTGELERRNAPRCDPDSELVCSIRDPHSNQWHSAAIRDISTTGIALLTDTPFETESLLTIELKHSERNLVHKCLIEVRHSDICYPNDAWLHGCRFVHPLDEDELRSML